MTKLVPVCLNSAWHRPSHGSMAVPTHSVVVQALARGDPMNITHNTVQLHNIFVTNIYYYLHFYQAMLCIARQVACLSIYDVQVP